MRRELKENTQVRLDEDKPNSSIVTVVSQTKGKLFTKVRGDESEWDVMTIRLTDIL